MNTISANTIANLQLMDAGKWYEVSQYDCQRLVAQGLAHWNSMTGWFVTYEGRKQISNA